MESFKPGTGTIQGHSPLSIRLSFKLPKAGALDIPKVEAASRRFSSTGTALALFRSARCRRSENKILVLMGATA